MRYQMNEGELTVPDDWKDESLHIFKARETDGFNLVVNRDRVPKGKTPEEYLDDQFKQIRDNLSDYRENALRYIDAGGIKCPLLDFTWSSPEGRMYQLNMMWVYASQMVSFTYTSSQPFSETQKEALVGILETFEPRSLEEK